MNNIEKFTRKITQTQCKKWGYIIVQCLESNACPGNSKPGKKNLNLRRNTKQQMKVIRISWLRYLAFHTFHFVHQMTLNIKICVKVMKFLHNAYVALHFTYGLETTLKHGNWFQSNDYVSTALLYNYSLKMVEIKVKLFIFFFLSPDDICTRCTQGSAS